MVSIRQLSLEIVDEMIRDVGDGDIFKLMRVLLEMYEVKFFKIYSEAFEEKVEHYFGIWFDEDDNKLFDVHFKGDNTSVMVHPEEIIPFAKVHGLIPIACIHNHPEGTYRKVLSPADLYVFYVIGFPLAMLLYPTEQHGLGLRMYDMRPLLELGKKAFNEMLNAFQKNIKSPAYTLEFQEKLFTKLNIRFREVIYK